MSDTLDERALRKAWLKKKFASWEYHEELLHFHQQYLTSLRTHWARADIQDAYPEDFKAMQNPVFNNLDRVQRPGEISRIEWHTKPSTGWADSISYNFNRGMDFAGCDEYAGMTQAECGRLNMLVGEMLTRCTNIRITSEGRWDESDDEILNERYTGLVVWPEDWRQELSGESSEHPPADAVPQMDSDTPRSNEEAAPGGGGATSC